MTLQKKPGELARSFAKIVTGRMALHSLPEDEIARQCRATSSEALYSRLSYEGYPICRVCGETDVPPNHCASPPVKRPRRARSTSEAIELPAAKDAAELFRQALEALEYAIDDLDERKEMLQGERFHGTGVYHMPTVFSRRSFSEEEWKKLCEQYSQDSSVESFTVRDLELPPIGVGVPLYE